MDLQKGISIKTEREKNIFVGVLKITVEKSRIRIRQSQERVRGTTSVSVTKCHGS
jgi:hypothetical protein